MAESSKNVSPVDTGGSVGRKLEITSLDENVTNATTVTTSVEGGPSMNPSQGLSRVPIPFPSADFRHLAELYWNYPSVHQTYVVSAGFHTNQTLLAKARRKSEKLKRELDKEPHQNRVSHHAPSYVKSKGSRKTAADINKRDRKSRALIPATTPVQQRRRTVNTSLVTPAQQRRRTVNTSLVTPAQQRRRTVNTSLVNPAQQRRRTVNMSLVAPTNKNINVNRKVTMQPVPLSRTKRESKGRKTDPDADADPGAALAAFQTSQGITRPTMPSDKTPEYEETPAILDALREQREDLEKREVEKSQQSRLFSKRNQKRCCGAFQKCTWSYKITHVAFFVLVVVIIILCSGAIMYPIVKAVMLRKGNSVVEIFT